MPWNYEFFSNSCNIKITVTQHHDRDQMPIKSKRNNGRIDGHSSH